MTCSDAHAASRLCVLPPPPPLRRTRACMPCSLARSGAGDLWGVKQSGRSSLFTSLTWQELQAAPQLLEHARGAAAALLPRLGSAPQGANLKAALLAYQLMRLDPGSSLPVLRDGVSGV